MQIRSKLVAVALLGTMSGGAMVAGSAGAAASTGVAGVGGRAILAPLPGGAAPGGRSVLGLSQLGSSNWSGYAQGAANGTYQSVVDTWKVPIVKPGVSGKQFSSDWVGIGGLNDGTLVQAGTEADNSNGTAFYQAWTEVLPAPEDPLSLVVHPGDTIKTSVVFSSTTKTWTMTVKDLTTGLKGKRTASKKAVGSSEGSVEAIHERPCIADGCTSVNDLANLTKTNNVTFDPGEYGTSTKPKTPLMHPAPGATVDQILMVNNADTAVIASPSNPDSDNDGFTVADGSTQPPPPSS
jgi:Peptidase A4 family